MWTRFVCWFWGHDWSMTRGYRGEPHVTAHCERCKVKAVDLYPYMKKGL